MKLKELYELIDGFAPFALCEEYIGRGAYDNSGIILDCGKNVKGVLFSLDLSMRAIEAAKEAGANCIVTHHPGIWEAVKPLNGAASPKITACIQAGISVISAHLNLDAAENGIDEWLMRGLGGETPLACMEELSKGAYGRVYDVKECSMKVFSERTAQIFRTKKMLVYGNAPVKRVASFCGGGFTYSAVDFALSNGADTLVSSDAKHHLITEAVERGLNVILLTHYAAENYGFSRFADVVRRNVKIPVTTFADDRYL